MKWIKKFNLFLFDMDGLLVNTEIIHYQAYIDMLAKRGHKLDWDFLKYCDIAHIDNNSLRSAIYAQFPTLQEEMPIWEHLRQEKNRLYVELLASSKVELLKGVEELLKALQKENIKRVVVTNSSKEMTDMIKAKAKTLQTIEHFITRDDYEKPKPSPEGYLKAITLFGEKGDKIIGFEDSLRGLKALQETPATSVLIRELNDPKIESFITGDTFHFKSLDKVDF